MGDLTKTEHEGSEGENESMGHYFSSVGWGQPIILPVGVFRKEIFELEELDLRGRGITPYEVIYNFVKDSRLEN